jgi:glutaredoxin-related protein
MLQSRMFDYAISTLEEGYKKFPGQHNLLLQIATLYQWRLSYIEALKRYLRYMEAVKNQFVLVQSRILNMLDNYDDAKPVIEYLEQRNNDYRYREIESSILLKFKKYDLAFPLLRDNYRPEQFSRYISYAREAQKRKNIDFAKKLLTFLFEKEKNETRRRELKLLNIELAISSLSDKAPLDSVEILAEELSSLYPTLQGQNKIKALKLFLQIYRDNLNDLDKAKDYARLGIEESANTRDADFFRFNLAKLYFREKNYSRVKSIFKQIKTASLKSEVLFLKLLANYGENGIERLEKELSQALKKIKPDDIRYNDLLELKLIISEKDSSIKILMLDGILNYYGHRYNIAGKYFTRTLENSALKIPLSGMAFEWLFKSSNYTDPRIFTEKALTYISGNPADELNPGLLLLLTKSDPGNAEKYMSKILEIFPKSLEASKVRSMIRKREAL